MTTCLILPGLNGSGPDHWQTRWETTRAGCERVQFGRWSNPDRAGWVAELDRMVMEAATPVVLVAHSLGCHAAAWWTASVPAAHVARIVGAMLVAPPDLGGDDLMEQLRSFVPPSLHPLPFPSMLIASRDDPYCTFAHSEHLARAWAATLIDVGRKGHINAQSCLGDLPEGQVLLERLLTQLSIRNEGEGAERDGQPAAPTPEKKND